MGGLTPSITCDVSCSGTLTRPCQKIQQCGLNYAKYECQTQLLAFQNNFSKLIKICTKYGKKPWFYQN